MIDVVIVAKNEQRHLGAVLSSLAEQKDFSGDIKVHLVDNGSTDDTIEIANMHDATVIHCQGSLGEARNIGIKFGANALVAFLDAHSVPAPNWADSLSRAFENQPDLGGAMGSLVNISERPGTALLAKHSIYSSPEKLWQSTVSGLRSPLPWIPTGNCMYSREALKDVGGFNTTFLRCEDTDLSWRVVLKGYQLAYVPDARVTHYDRAGATSFLRKHYQYGAGAAELSQHYGLQPRPPKHNTLRGTKRLLDYCYQLGFKSKWKNLGISKEKYLVDERFRKTFPWSDQFSLALSRLAIFWFVDSDTCICINQTDESRLVLKDLSALMFKLLSEHTNRVELIKDVSRQFDAAESEIASDVDAFVQQLLDDRILVKSPVAKFDTVDGNLAGVK